MMVIRRIVEADFRKSELSIFREFAQHNKAFIRALKGPDVMVFVSKKGDQLIFVHNFTVVTDEHGIEKEALKSIKHRIVGGSWNPLRLRNYAAEAGLSVPGLKLFEEHYESLLSGSHTAATRKAA